MVSGRGGSVLESYVMRGSALKQLGALCVSAKRLMCVLLRTGVAKKG